ncbi:MAG TPA: hypothetical protein VLF60_01125 [Candidatus Saccharimonadales bacterium]|nr:hypothetical protein [Candidatus Saccharimonadales bacterium]
MADDKKAPVTDDQELAKVLASMSDQANGPQMPADQSAPAADQPAAAPTDAPAAPAERVFDENNIPPIPATLPTAAPAASMAAAPTAAPTISAHGATISPSTGATATPLATGSLDDIKRQALDQLRPIVSKLDLPAEEKFDALLLVIRSSDDQSLVQAAYQAAEGIADEAKKAQALLDIVKEIEYFSSQGKQ